MRLVQVRDLLAGQGWFDLVQHRVNPPDGTPMHWSRLVDAPIAAMIVGLRPLLGPEAAERWAVLLWPLVPALLLLPSAGLIGNRLAGAPGAVLTILAAGLAVPLVRHFVPGRIDHHNVQMALSMALVAALVFIPRRPRRVRGRRGERVVDRRRARDAALRRARRRRRDGGLVAHPRRALRGGAGLSLRLRGRRDARARGDGRAKPLARAGLRHDLDRLSGPALGGPRHRRRGARRWARPRPRRRGAGRRRHGACGARERRAPQSGLPCRPLRRGRPARALAVDEPPRRGALGLDAVPGRAGRGGVGVRGADRRARRRAGPARPAVVARPRGGGDRRRRAGARNDARPPAGPHAAVRGDVRGGAPRGRGGARDRAPVAPPARPDLGLRRGGLPREPVCHHACGSGRGGAGPRLTGAARGACRRAAVHAARRVPRPRRAPARHRRGPDLLWLLHPRRDPAPRRRRALSPQSRRRPRHHRGVHGETRREPRDPCPTRRRHHRLLHDLDRTRPSDRGGRPTPSPTG